MIGREREAVKQPQKGLCGLSMAPKISGIFSRLTSIFSCRCDSKNECKMLVNSDVFGDPCPGTHKYVEVHFACAPRVLATTTKRPLPPWFLQGGADNLWSNPNKKANPTSTSQATSSLVTSTTQEKAVFAVDSGTIQERKPILVTSDSSVTSTTTPESTTPVRIPITTPTTTTTTTTESTTTTTASTEASTASEALTSQAEADVITDIINEYEIEKGEIFASF